MLSIPGGRTQRSGQKRPPFHLAAFLINTVQGEGGSGRLVQMLLTRGGLVR